MASTKGEVMSITKIKRKRKTVYFAQVYLNGVRVKSKSFDTKTEAYVWHDKEKARLKEGKTFLDEELREIFFEDCVKRYLKEHVSNLKFSSQRNLCSFCQRFLMKSPLAKIKMSDLNHTHVDHWIQWLFRNFKDTCNRHSFRLELRRFGSVLHWWRNYVDPGFQFPVVQGHRNRCHFKLRESEMKRPDYFVKPHEVRLWLDELQKIQNPVYYRLAQFMILTGARVSEACGLLWSEVDFENKFARVVRSADWSHSTPQISETTKTKTSVRVLTLPEKLVELLREMKEESQGSSLVFRSAKDGVVPYSTVRWAFDKSFKACGLSWRGTHICRHTYATMALMATNSISAVQASLGHKDQQMTQRYAKVVALINSDMAEKTAKMYEVKTLNRLSEVSLVKPLPEPEREIQSLSSLKNESS